MNEWRIPGVDKPGIPRAGDRPFVEAKQREELVNGHFAILIMSHSHRLIAVSDRCCRLLKAARLSLVDSVESLGLNSGT